MRFPVQTDASAFAHTHHGTAWIYWAFCWEFLPHAVQRFCVANPVFLLILSTEDMIPGVHLLNSLLNAELNLLIIFSPVLLTAISGSHWSFNEFIFTRYQWGDYLLFTAGEPVPKKSIYSLQALIPRWIGFDFSKDLACFQHCLHSHFPEPWVLLRAITVSLLGPC